MNRWLSRYVLTLVLASLPLGTVYAQGDTTPGAPGEVPPVEEEPAEPAPKKPVKPADADEEEDEEAGAPEEQVPTQPAIKPKLQPAVVTPPVVPVEEEEPAFEPLEQSDSPIADLAAQQDQDFVPLEDIEEEAVDPIFPAKMYPHVDWNGMLRFKQITGINLHLGTGGTSAILPPTETYTPVGNPADPDARSLWTASMLARFEPTFSITEGIRLHVEADLLRNQVLGSLPINSLALNSLHPDPSRNAASGGQFSPREREWFNGPLYIGEAYGELTGFFGSLRLGRMDNDWGLGMFYNGGDCVDCDFGDSIDRAQLASSFRGINGSFSWDFPGEGPSSRQPQTPQGQPYDLGQIDDVKQFTVTASFEPKTRPEQERQLKRLSVDRKPVFNGGALFSRRAQKGALLTPFDSNGEDVLVYRGLRMFVGDVWGRFEYAPNSKTHMKIEVETMGIFGNIDNARYEAVGRADESDENSSDLNCFDEDVRTSNSQRCTPNAKSFNQFGLALRSEFAVSDPITFGLDGGFASGGSAANWGYGADAYQRGDDLDFFRFDPDYNVDLILFERIIGTVSNAYYFKPHMEATFLNRNEYKLRLDIDTIISRAVNAEGTPSGQDQWLGVEVDSAFRFFIKDYFHAGIQGGLLFPLAGLGARIDRPRLTVPGSAAPEFSEDQDPSTAWTLQFNTAWTF